MRRRRYSQNFMRWARHFMASSPTRERASRLGLGQFHALESRGERPAQPDPFFGRLLAGKQMHDALAKAVRATYGTDRWEGYAGDRERMPDWLFRAFYAWHPVVRGPSTALRVDE